MTIIKSNIKLLNKLQNCMIKKIHPTIYVKYFFFRIYKLQITHLCRIQKVATAMQKNDPLVCSNLFQGYKGIGQ